MVTRKRLSPEESRLAALEAARGLLIETGPQSVTLKAVGARIGRTHANLLHHFGSAAGLQKALAGHLARLKSGGDFSAEAITNPNGWSGVDGIFRFLPNGRSERALAVIAVQAGPGVVVSPAPTTFATPVN